MSVVPAASANLGNPGSSIVGLVGTCELPGWNYCFAQTGDGSLWALSNLNGVWAPWANLGTPPGGLQVTNCGNAVISAGNSIWVFAVGKDQQVWCNLWNGETWQWIAAPGKPQNAPVTALLGVTNTDGLKVYASAAGATWRADWNGLVWTWAQSEPPTFAFPFPVRTWDHDVTKPPAMVMPFVFVPSPTTIDHMALVFQILNGTVQCDFYYSQDTESLLPAFLAALQVMFKAAGKM